MEEKNGNSVEKIHCNPYETKQTLKKVLRRMKNAFQFLRKKKHRKAQEKLKAIKAQKEREKKGELVEEWKKKSIEKKQKNI